MPINIGGKEINPKKGAAAGSREEGIAARAAAIKGRRLDKIMDAATKSGISIKHNKIKNIFEIRDGTNKLIGKGTTLIKAVDSVKTSA